MIRKVFTKVNERLIPRLRVSKATGHTGRHSFTSAAENMQEGMSRLFLWPPSIKLRLQ